MATTSHNVSMLLFSQVEISLNQLTGMTNSFYLFSKLNSLSSPSKDKCRNATMQSILPYLNKTV